MNLRTVFVRFYKSFNFDYLKKYHAKAERKPWEMLDDLWYPYIRIPIDSKVTTVVGANESGKSHLLSAIEKGIYGKEIKREDFCRYSQFFTVERGKLKSPEFGFEWTNLSDEDKEKVLAACDITQPTTFDHFLMFRTNRNPLTLYLPKESEYSEYNLTVQAASNFQKYLPRVFRIDAEIALPDSVPIRQLALGSLNVEEDRIESLGATKKGWVT